MNRHVANEVFFVLFFLGAVATTGTEAQAPDCSPERLRQCSFVVQDEMTRRNVGHQEVHYHCRALRQGVDCLVRQVTLCPTTDDRARIGDTIWKAWKYLQTMCDAAGGGWWHRPCYRREDIHHCERLYPLDVKSVARPSCQTYNNLRDCVTGIVYRACDQEDRFVLGTYLMDKGQELVWTCPATPAASTFDRIAAGGGIATGGLSIGGVSGLRDPGAAPPLSPTALAQAGCNSRANREMQSCYERYLQDRREASTYSSEEEIVKRTCCASFSYRRCVEEARNNYCTSPSYRDIDLFVPTSITEESTCRRYWLYTCAGCRLGTGLLWAFVGVALVHLSRRYILL